MGSMVMDLVLTGPRAGWTGTINGNAFVNGVLRLQGQGEQLQHAVQYYASYGAYPRGSAELEHWQKFYADLAEKEGKANGVSSESDPSPEQGQADEVQRQAEPAGKQAPEEAGADGKEPAQAEAGDRGPDSGGGGHPDAGVPDQSEAGAGGEKPQDPQDDPVTSKLRSAVMGLDPANDEHWTTAGKPKMDAVQSIAERTDITRRDLESAAPDWNRDKAAAAAAL